MNVDYSGNNSEITQPLIQNIYEEDIKFLDDLSDNKPITYQYVEEILCIIEKNGFSVKNQQEINYSSSNCQEHILRCIKKHVDSNHLEIGHKWCNHLIRLCKLETCHRNSKTFDIQRLVRIFYMHIEFLKRENFTVNENLNGQTLTVEGLSSVDFTPIALAVNKSAPALLTALIKSGADVNCAYKDGSRSPLHFIPEKGSDTINDEMITILTENGCDPNARKSNYSSPLWCMALRGHTRNVRSLVRAKANVNLLGRDCLTSPLQEAASMGFFPTVKAIVEFGGDLFYKKNNAGRIFTDGRLTAEELARTKDHLQKDYLQIAKYLGIRMTLLNYIPVSAVSKIVLEYFGED